MTFRHLKPDVVAVSKTSMQNPAARIVHISRYSPRPKASPEVSANQHVPRGDPTVPRRELRTRNCRRSNRFRSGNRVSDRNPMGGDVSRAHVCGSALKHGRVTPAAKQPSGTARGIFWIQLSVPELLPSSARENINACQSPLWQSSSSFRLAIGLNSPWLCGRVCPTGSARGNSRSRTSNALNSIGDGLNILRILGPRYRGLKCGESS